MFRHVCSSPRVRRLPLLLLLKRPTSSRAIRRTFLEFFASSSPGGPHLIVPSASVVPHNDASLTFVNAGMNQFKDVFLGRAAPPAAKVANVQKCVRVGGKHNDIGEVGLDGHHHTFFEMMGNWSFGAGEHFKREACGVAWELLTGPYGLAPEKLFAGNPGLNLPPDLETRDHWRALGVPDSRILPFGSKDNFWEMGATGPCGPCTEIHYDHCGRGPSGVNQGFDDLVEVWNLVFMEYNRIDDLVLQSLATKHVDTGLGLERLTAVMGGATSNYDTDLFRPLFAAIARSTGAPEYGGQFKGSDHIDTKYRILADHARMITACVADGMFPDTTHRLRNVLRRALAVCQNDFKSDHRLIADLSYYVSEMLGSQYPEMQKNLGRVKTILEADAEHVRQMKRSGEKVYAKLTTEYPNAAPLVSTVDASHIYDALKFIDKHVGKVTEISGDVAFKLYQLGLTVDQIQCVAAVKKVAFEEEDFNRALLQVKRNSKLDGVMQLRDISKVPRTDVSAVHLYASPEPLSYQFSLVKTRISGMDRGERAAKQLLQGDFGIVYLDKTSFYAESGGQVGDKGELVSDRGAVFTVTDCQRVVGSPEHIAHLGVVQKGSFKVGDQVSARINTEHRLHCMQNHSAAHLLNDALHSLLPLTCQKSSFVGPDEFRFDFYAFKSKIDGEFVTTVEERVHKQIMANSPIRRGKSRSQDLLLLDNVISIPGEKYPVEVTTITLPSGRVEPCCGTHVLSTGDVQSFAVVSAKSVGSGVASLRCLAGARAAHVRENGVELIEEVIVIRDEAYRLDERSAETDVMNAIDRVRKKKKSMRDRKQFPFAVLATMFSVLDECLRHLLSLGRMAGKTSMQDDIQQVIEDNSHLPFIAHYFDISDSPKISLSKISRLVEDKPILLIAKAADGVYARACVPETSVSDSFDAEKWVSSVADHLGGKVASPRGQDRTKVCNMIVTKNPNSAKKTALAEALYKAELFAGNSLQN